MKSIALLVATLAAAPAAGATTYSVSLLAGGGDGSLLQPTRVTVDAQGNVYVADNGHYRIRRIDAVTGVATTFAGSGMPGCGVSGVPATDGDLDLPRGMAFDAAGNLFIADFRCANIRRVDRVTGLIETLPWAGPDFSFVFAAGVAVATNGDLLVADPEFGVIYRRNPDTGVVTSIPGIPLSRPVEVSTDAQGNIYFASEHYFVGRVDAGTGLVSPVIGGSGGGFSGDGGPASLARLSDPAALTLDATGNLFIADRFNLRVRRVDVATQFIATVAGNSQDVATPIGGPGPARGGLLGEVTGVAADGSGNVYVVSGSHNAVYKLTPVPDLQRGDLDGDLKTDLLFANAGSGRLAAWHMNGTTRVSENLVEPAPDCLDWRLAGLGDFDFDRDSDLVYWNGATGELQLWLMDGTKRVGDPVLLTGATPPPTNWVPSAVADFNRDDWPDVLWHNRDSAKLAIWTFRGSERIGGMATDPAGPGSTLWDVVAAADFDGDIQPDVLWSHHTVRQPLVWLMNGATGVGAMATNPLAPSDLNWRAVAAGDYGAGPGGVQGTNDIVWRNDATGRVVVWHMDLAGNRTAGVFTSPDAPADALSWAVVAPR